MNIERKCAMLERTRRLPAYAIPLLLIGGGIIILTMTLWPRSAPSASTPDVTLAGVQPTISAKLPVAYSTNQANLPQPYPSTEARPNGSLPEALLTPSDYIESSSYPNFAFAEPGQPLTHTVNVYNAGAASAYNLVVTDQLTLSMTNPICNQWPDYTCAVRDGQMVYSFASPVAGGSTVSGTLHGELATVIPDRVRLGDQLDLSYSNKDGTPQPTIIASNIYSAYVRPNLPIAVSSVPETVRRGQLITYTVVFTNATDAPLTYYTVQDALPSTLIYVNCAFGQVGSDRMRCSYSPDARPEGGVLFYYQDGGVASTLGVRESMMVIITAMVGMDAPDGAAIINQINVLAPMPIASIKASSKVVVVAQPEIVMNDYPYGVGNATFGPSPIYPDQPIKNRIPYRNIGGAAAYNLRLTALLPPGFVADACDAGAGSQCTTQTGQIVYTITNPSPFPVDASGVVSLTMHPTISAAKGVTLGNTLLADYGDAAGNPYKAEATIQRYVVITPTTMTISVDDGQASVEPGQLVTYTIAVTNTGSLSTDSFYVADLLPAGLSYVNCSIEPGSKMGVGCGEEKGNDIVPQPHISLSQNDEGPNIMPGQSMTMSVTARVECAAVTGTNLTNRTVLYYNGDYAGLPAEDTDTVLAGAGGCSGR